MKRTSIPVNCWAREDIPSNKLIDDNPDYLSNTELLSIILGTGSDTENSVDLARRILMECDNKLSRLAKTSTDRLISLRGIGRQKAARIMAALELGRRRQMETADEQPDLGTATRIYNNMAPVLRDLQHEEFWVLLMNQNYRLIRRFCLSKGGISEVSVDIRVIMREAVLSNATVIAVCHNHPSGRITPSRADDQLTQSIKRACEVMRLYFQDHVIITDGAYYSYHEQGKI